jgi:MFS family permease
MTLFSFLRENGRWLGAGALMSLMSSFGQTFFISIFAGEIRETFDLSHGAWGGIYTLGTAASAAVMVWAGGLTDRYRSRSLGIGVLLLLACACLFMALNVWAWLLPLAIFALRFCGQGMMSHIAVVSMSRWFVATRGRALSVAGLGYALGEAVLPLGFVALLLVVDWRWLWVIAAIACLGMIPILTGLLREERTPQSHAQQDSSVGMQNRHWKRQEVLRHPLFWFMIPALLGPSAFGTAFFFQQVYFADLKGFAHIELVAMFPFFTMAGVGMMLLSGWLLDRLGTPRLMPVYQLPMVAAFVIFAQGQSLFSIFVGLLVMAMTTGSNATIPNAFWAEFYGTRHLGSIKAMAAAVMVLGSALGPGITGLLIDLGIGLEDQYIGVSLYFAIATLCMAIGISRARRALG